MTIEGLEYVEQKQLYDRPAIRKYLQHCRTKFARVVDDKTQQTLSARCGFERHEFFGEQNSTSATSETSSTMHLNLHLRQLSAKGVEWAGSGRVDVQASKRMSPAFARPVRGVQPVSDSN